MRHARGETRIAGRPRRVVALSYESTESVLALGVKPVGAVRSWGGSPWYPHIADRLSGVMPVGDEESPDFDRIEASRPDLILGVELRHSALFERLSGIAPTVFCETLRGRWQQNLRLWAEALGRAQEADALLADWRRRVEATRLRIPGIAETRVAVLRFLPNGLRIYHEDSFSGRILADLGLPPSGFPASVAHFENVAPVQVALLEKADFLLYFTSDDGSGRAPARESETRATLAWRSLPAVRGGRAVRIDEGLWNTSGGLLAARRVLDALPGVLGRDRP